MIDELIKYDVPVIAVDTRESELKDIADAHPKAQYVYIVGDATDDDIMVQANLNGARGLVAALSSDKDNLYLTVTARQQNPAARIIARCAELSHVEKIRRSGADAVVSPNYIGGLRMVSEMLRPSVVRRRVSGITATSNSRAFRRATVRLTPSRATEPFSTTNRASPFGIPKR